MSIRICLLSSPAPLSNLRKTQTMVNIGTFPHIFKLLSSFSEFFLQDFFLELRGLTTVLAQRDEKITKENKKKKIKPFCTLVAPSTG